MMRKIFPEFEYHRYNKYSNSNGGISESVSEHTFPFWHRYRMQRYQIREVYNATEAA